MQASSLNLLHRDASTLIAAGVHRISLPRRRSDGKIPEVFLRGCGVPHEFIAYIGSMVGRPIEFYSCFISYSTLDQEFAERLYNDLQGNKVRCWFAPHDIKGGRKIYEQIDEAIRLHDRLLLILSEHSMSGEWVNTEICKAVLVGTDLDLAQVDTNGRLVAVSLVYLGDLRWLCVIAAAIFIGSSLVARFLSRKFLRGYFLFSQAQVPTVILKWIFVFPIRQVDAPLAEQLARGQNPDRSLQAVILCRFWRRARSRAMSSRKS